MALMAYGGGITAKRDSGSKAAAGCVKSVALSRFSAGRDFAAQR